MKPAFDGQLAAQISKQLQQQFAPLNNTFTGTLSPQDMAAINKMSGFQQPRQERLSEKAREANIEAFNEQLALNAKTMGEVFVQNTKDKPIEEQYRAFQQAQEALKNQYANLSEEQLGIALTAFNEQADVFAKADKEAGFFARTGDALSYIPTTATKLGEQLTGLFSPDGSARQWFADATNEVESWRSDEAKLRALQSAEAMAQAKARGELGFTQFFSNAADNLLETLGQFAESAIPTAASALVGAAAAPITGGASLALPFVVGGVQGAGSARNEIHDHIMAMPEAQLQQNAQYQTLLAKGLNPEQARAELAGSFAEHGGEVLATGLSSAVLSGLGGLGRIGQVGKGVMGSTAGKFASELVTEPTDEVFQQFMANKAIRDVDATHSLTDGLGEAAAGGLLFGAAGGAVAAADNIYRTPSAESVQQQSDGVVENIVAQGNAEPPQPTVQQTAQPQQAVENPQNVANQPIQAEVELQQSENIAPTQPSVEVDNEADVTNLEPNIETENNPKQTLQNGTRYSLNESNDSDFIRSIEDISSGKRKGRDDRYLNMGTTPDVFKMIGLPDTKVSMRESVIDKVTQGKHKIDIDDFKQLPNQINNPIAVTKSRTRPNGYVVLTELNENVDGVKKPVIAALHLNKTNNGLEVVNIVSSYGRNISQLNEDIKESLYWNKTKGYPFARTVGLQLPSSLASVDNLSVGNIKTEADLSQYQSGKNTATPNQIEQDQATLSRILGEKTASHIQVVDSNTQVPTGQNVKKLAANGVEGWFDVSAQKLYIISDNITANEVLSRDERLAWVAFHELSHAGVRIKYGPILTNVLASAGKNVVVKVLTRKIQAEYGYTQEVAIEEAMAEIYAAFETGTWPELESRYKVKIHQSYKQGKDSVGDFLTKVANILRRLIGGIVGKDLTQTMTTSQVFETLRGIQQGVNDIANTEPNQTDSSADNRYSFAGRNAKTANHSLLEQAERDLASGKNAEEIRQETGWFKGLDGKWRFEIDDSQISFKQNFDETDNALSVLQKSGGSNQPVATVGDILNAPELFAAYPDIAKINVVNSNDDYTAGGYSSDDFISLDSNLPVNKIKSTLLHELQHAIQNREQFAYGGSIDPRFIYVLQQELYENVEDSRLALQRLNGKYSVYTAFISKGKEAELKRKEFVIYRSVAKLRDYAYAENITRYRKHILDNVNLVHGLLLDIKNGKLSVTDKVRKTLSSIDGKTWNLPNQRSDDFPHALRVLALDTAEAFDSVIRNESRAEFDNDKRAFNTISRALDKAYDAVYDDAENARNVIRNAERQVRKAEALESKYGHHNASPYQIYTAMAGEVEARNVETRMNMTAEERLNRSPESTEDVRRDEQIVRYADGSIANSLNENPNSAFARAVTQVANGNVPNGRISMGTTPDVLKMLGLPDTEIRITGGIIQKVMSEYLGVDKGKNSHIHNLTPDTLKQLPQQMNNPVAVFRSSTKADAYVVLTELMEVDVKTGKEKPVVSALHINTGKGNVDVIDVRSVYGRGDNQLSTAFRDDLLYFNKTKGQQFLKTHPLQLHWDLTSDANLSSRNVKTEADLRQYQTENSNNDVRYSVKQSVADLAKTGKAKADQTFIDELKTKDYNGFKKRFDKAVGKLDEWVADGLRPVNDWIDNTLKDSGISAHEAERLKDNMYRAKGVRDALNSELEQAYLKPLLKKVAEVAKKHKLDELSAKRLIGYWASTRYAIEKNNEILAREHQAMLNAEKALNDAKAKGGDIEALSAEYRKAERQYRDRKHDVELALNSDEEFKVGTAGGWSNAEAQHIMENIEKHIPRKELELAVSYLYALNQRRLEIDHKAGRYTEEQYKEFRKNRHYVPLTGDPNADENFDGISGASQNAVNVSKDRALKGRKLSEAEDGIDASWRGINNSTTYAGWVDFKNSIDDIFENTVSELVGKGHSERSAREQAEKTLGISKQRMQGTTRSSDDVLIRKVGGIYYEYKLPQEVITALKNDNVENANAFLKVLSTPTSWYARGVTQWTITFAPMNMLRDTWEKSEFIRVQKLYDKEGNLLDDKTMDKIGRAVLKNAFYNKGTWKATKRMGFNQELRNEGDEALLNQLLELGGVSTYSTYLAKTETDLVKKVKTHNSYLGKKLEQAGSLLESYNKVFDTVSALAAFKAMLDHGVDAKQAAAKTLELTNFRKTGSKMRGIKALYMFSQPTAMGARNLIKYLSTPKGRNRFFGYMAVMMPLYLALRAMDDEDEGGNVMDQLGDITRYIPFPIGDGKYFKFPVGFGMPQMAWNFSVNTVKAIAGDISFTEAGTNMLVHSMKTFAPVSPSEISAAKFPLAKLTLTATPTILQPLMQNVLNRSAFGNQITTNFVVENKLKAEQSKSTTAQFWKDLAVGVNDTFGIDMHPEQIKNLFDGYGAMFGSLRELQTIFIENPNREQLGRRTRTPFLNQFIGTTNEFAVQSRYYEASEEARAFSTRYKSRKERGIMDELSPQDRAMLNWHNLNEKRMGELRAEKGKLTRALREKKINANVYEARIKAYNEKMDKTQRVFIKRWREMQGLNTH